MYWQDARAMAMIAGNSDQKLLINIFFLPLIYYMKIIIYLLR